MVMESIYALINAQPVLSIIILSVIVTFISTILTKWLTNQEHLKSLKERQKEIQKELKTCKDECLIKELQAEMMSIAGTMMKSSFKPMLITFIPFLILIYWIRDVYGPLMGFSWFWWYLGTSIISSIILRKVLKMA